MWPYCPHSNQGWRRKSVQSSSNLPVQNFKGLCFSFLTVHVLSLLFRSGAVTVSEERKLCTDTEKFSKMCKSNEVGGYRYTAQGVVDILSWKCNLKRKHWVIFWLIFFFPLTFVFCVCVSQLDLTFHLFVCALAGAGAAVIAMVRDIIVNGNRTLYLKTLKPFAE